MFKHALAQNGGRQPRQKAPRQRKVVEKEVEFYEPPENRARRAAVHKRGMQTSGVGASIGNAILPGLGGLLGHAAEGLFKTILGSGDYTEAEHISKPLPVNNTILGLQSPPVTNMVQEMHWNGQATRIAHREYIGSISMSSGYAAAQYQIEPTSTFMFPWMSRICPSFQKWKLLGMAFEYVPTSAQAISAGTPAVGFVALGINYDQAALLPSSMANLLNTQGSISGRPQDGIVCPVECDPGLTPLNPLYIAPAGILIDEPKFYMFGNLTIATEGPAAYTNCGQLWVTYDMLLISAYVPSPAAPGPIPRPVIGDGSFSHSESFTVVEKKVGK
jgi:hypothetical protein